MVGGDGILMMGFCRLSRFFQYFLEKKNKVVMSFLFFGLIFLDFSSLVVG
jgi:hypothetical protein